MSTLHLLSKGIVENHVQTANTRNIEKKGQGGQQKTACIPDGKGEKATV